MKPKIMEKFKMKNEKYKVNKIIEKSLIALFSYCLIVLNSFFSCAFAGVLDECYKIYPVEADNLFMASLNVLNSNNK